MSNSEQTAFHSVDEEWLASYSAGGLSPAKRLLIACQAAIKPDIGSRLNMMDAVGGSILESSQGTDVSDDFLDRVMHRVETTDLPATSESANENSSARHLRDKWAPSPLEDFLKRRGQSLKWKKLGFGVERASIANNNGEDLYLLKARPGLKIPQHTHAGEEWALVLQGGYHVGDVGYGIGDLHREDENCHHSPVVDHDDLPCITLVAIEGGLKFSNPLMRLLKPVIGI